MSGGPVQNINGSVIGIISHGTSEAEESTQAYGYAASIGAILELKLGILNDLGKTEEYEVGYVAQVGFLVGDDDPPMTLQRSDEGVTLSWAATDQTSPPASAPELGDEEGRPPTSAA